MTSQLGEETQTARATARFVRAHGSGVVGSVEVASVNAVRSCCSRSVLMPGSPS